MEGETYGFVTIRGRVHCYLTDELMSAYGYKQTFRELPTMSALPPTADIVRPGNERLLHGRERPREARKIVRQDRCVLSPEDLGKGR